MLRNQRRKIPYLSASIIILCMAALAILETRGLGEEAGGTPYVPMAWLYDNREDSLQDYTQTGRLPLCYQFGNAGYQVDIPNIHYQGTGSGIAAGVSDSLWLYIAEYDRKERGINMALGELPPFFLGSAYNRNSSYISMEKTQEGYLSGLAAEYAYGDVILALGPGLEMAGAIAIFDFTVGDKGVCIAAMTTEPAEHAKDACRDQAWEIALSMRPNPDFKMSEKEGDAACGDRETVGPGYKIEEVTVADLCGEGKQGDSGGASGLKTQYVEPMPAAGPAPVPEPTLPPGPGLATEQETVPVPGHGTGSIPQMALPDVNEQPFNAPLTGVAMSITVTLGFSGSSAVTVSCPDGTVLNPAAVDGNVFSFSTTAQPGTYVVVTTGYSAAGSVRVHVHCG